MSIRYSKKDVQRAGEALISDNLREAKPELFKWSMEVLSDWRANHAHSLDHVTNLLQEKSHKVDGKSIVVKRLKRTPSIIKKLRRFNTMKLRNMQDIAGCRSILSSTKNVHKLKRKLNKKHEYRVRDHIKTPKPDGYRGVHLIKKFKSNENENQYPVEIQLRSKIQHSWATAVEIIDLFTNQALKSNEGKQDWLDFFKYISHEFSKLEQINNPLIEESLTESIRLAKKLGVYNKFKGYAESLHFIDSRVKQEIEGYNLVQIDFTEQTVKVRTFPFIQFEMATTEYLEYEKKAAENTKSVVALVSSQSIDNLKEAYPNYFADSALFVYNLRKVEKKYVLEKQKILTKWLAQTGLNENT